jgi:hypothetical protein
LSASLHRLTWPTSAPFRVRAAARIRPVIRNGRRGSRPSVSVSCCLSAAGVGLLGHPVPAGGSAFLTVSAPRHVTVLGSQRGCRVPHEQDTTGVGAPYIPGPAVFPGRGWVRRPAPAAFQRLVLHPATASHLPGLTITRHQRGFTCVHPSGLPLRLWHPGGTDALGLDHLSFAPRRYQQRTSGWGQAIEH